MIAYMAQRPKGPRRQVGPRLPHPVYEQVLANCEALGVSSMSQYVADLMSIISGRPDLVRELGTSTRHDEVLNTALSRWAEFVRNPNRDMEELPLAM